MIGNHVFPDHYVWVFAVVDNYGIVLWNGPEDNPFPENCLIFNSEDYSTGYD